jgi:hypothetical protein
MTRTMERLIGEEEGVNEKREIGMREEGYGKGEGDRRRERRWEKIRR